jgi:Rrf2 family iron-sulfur cluster assembly transcriptional regulator
MFSKACEYAIRATLYLSSKADRGEKAGLKDIAAQIDSPEAFTAKILQQLVKNSIVTSVKGPSGGFGIEPSGVQTITLQQIVKAIDGDAIYVGCGLGLKACSEKNPCPLHHQFKAIRDGLREMLETTTLYDLSNGLKAGVTFLK